MNFHQNSWYFMNHTDFYISGGNLPLEKVWISLGFSRSGPFCWVPLCALSVFCISAEIHWISRFYVKMWNSVEFIEIPWFHEICGFCGSHTSKPSIFPREYWCFCDLLIFIKMLIFHKNPFFSPIFMMFELFFTKNI